MAEGVGFVAKAVDDKLGLRVQKHGVSVHVAWRRSMPQAVQDVGQLGDAAPQRAQRFFRSFQVTVRNTVQTCTEAAKEGGVGVASTQRTSEQREREKEQSRQKKRDTHSHH